MGNTLYIQGKCLQDIGNIIAFQGMFQDKQGLLIIKQENSIYFQGKSIAVQGNIMLIMGMMQVDKGIKRLMFKNIQFKKLKGSNCLRL